MTYEQWLQETDGFAEAAARHEELMKDEFVQRMMDQRRREPEAFKVLSADEVRSRLAQKLGLSYQAPTPPNPYTGLAR